MAHLNALSMPQAACVLIFEPTSHRILAVSRRDDPTAFGLPGGKVDPGETPVHAARREALEETGFAVRLEQHLLTAVCFGEIPHLTTTYLATITGWNGPSSESGRVAWATWTDLFRGPFRDYNRQLYKIVRRLFPSLRHA